MSRRQILKRAIYILPAAVMMLFMGLIPMAVITVYADQEVQYVERRWNGMEVEGKTLSASCTEINGSTEGISGWYVVDGNIESSKRLVVTGTANIILKSGSRLYLEDGINVPAGTTLNIYSEDGEGGELYCDAYTNDNAAIGANDQNGDCGTVNIHGGRITADTKTKGTDGAGIGGGDEGNGGTVRIYGGNVTAIGGQFGAGIGGGDRDNDKGGNGGDTYIYGGTVNATGGENGAGIGGGELGSGGNVVIYGGNVTATGGTDGAGIGGGDEGESGTQKIFGGTVTATGGSNGAGIGGGNDTAWTEIKISGGNVTATGGGYAAGIGGGDRDEQTAGGKIEISENPVIVATGGSNGAGIGGGDNGDGGIIEIKGTAADITATGGIYAAGIGGGNDAIWTEINISGGSVTATGGILAAGIGGGSRRDNKTKGGTIKINGNPVIVATGGENGAGIGGGEYTSGGNITISGGSISATGGDGVRGTIRTGGAGIGGGDLGSGGNITITGGTINEAKGGKQGAGIGGGRGEAFDTISISGGKIKAVGGDYGAGIGSGCSMNERAIDGRILISGTADIEAVGGESSAGIGGGSECNSGNINISGGSIKATGGTRETVVGADHGGAGIGDGWGGPGGGSVTISGGTIDAQGGANVSGIGSGSNDKQTIITLTYTEDTYDISVKANSYRCGNEDTSATVKLEKDFKDRSTGTFYAAKEYTGGETDALNNKTLVPADACDVSFDANGGSGTKEKEVVASGASYTLPAADTFTVPEGKCSFASWQVTTGSEKPVNKASGETVTIAGDTTVKAIWYDHSWRAWEQIKAPTCVSEGEEERVCSRVAGHKETRAVNIDPDAHDWYEAEYAWTPDNSVANASRVCKHDPIAHKQYESANTTSEVIKQPTCDNKGKTTYTATFNNEAFETQTKTVEDIDALGHDWGEPTYEWAADNSTVTATRTCNRDAKHVETEMVSATSEVTKKPTCEEKGETTYTSEAFTNKAFEVQTKTVEDVDALGHSWGKATYTWAEDNSKVTATHRCTVCNVKESEKVYTTSKVTKEPACSEVGERTYTSADFDAPEFEVQTKTEGIAIDPNAHGWGEPTYKWADDNKTVTATRVCAHNAAHVETETVDVTSKVTKQPTCTEKGETTYTSAAFTNTAFKEQKKTEEDISALNHSWGEWINLDGEQHQRVCGHDAAHVEKANHTWDAGKVTKEATTTAEGEKTYTCTVCKGTKTETIPKLDPTPEPDPAPDPTPTPAPVPSAATMPATTVNVNNSTASAAAIQQAIQAAGGNADTLVLGKKVKKISKRALAGTGIKTIVVESKKLKKKSAKGSLKGSIVTTVKVEVGNTKMNKKYVKKYKKIFTKKNAGKKVKVKR